MAWAFLVGIVATVVVILMFFHPPVLHPVDAYCRGFSDGERHYLEVTKPMLETAGIPVEPEETVAAWQEAEEVRCNEVVRATTGLRPYLKGPLLAENE